MIAVISGFPMFGKPPSPGLAELAAELRRKHQNIMVLNLKWNQTPADAEFNPASEPLLLIGHSFGGCSAVMLSRHLEPRRVHLILIDPVRHQAEDRIYPIPEPDNPFAQLGAKPFDRGDNWDSVTALLRTEATWFFPYHQAIRDGDEKINLQVPHTDHNTIIRSSMAQTLIFTKADALFPPRGPTGHRWPLVSAPRRARLRRRRSRRK
jgi:pimeloyl-ACP methyl ester carboxylesterase